jgi:hypothetical protein
MWIFHSRPFARAVTSNSTPSVNPVFLGIRRPGTLNHCGMLACFNWSTKGCVQGLFDFPLEM